VALKRLVSNYPRLAFSSAVAVGMPRILKMVAVKQLVQAAQIHQAARQLINQKVAAKKSLRQYRRQHLVRRAALVINFSKPYFLPKNDSKLSHLSL
jgi:hypothetical protein